MSQYIRAWNKGSASAEALADEMNIPRIKHQGSRFVGGPGKTVINWGSSELPDQVLQCNVLNKPASVKIASNKLMSLRKLSDAGVNVPPFTTDRAEAQRWKDGGSTIVVRKLLNSSGGNGIEIIEPEDNVEIPAAPLYTVYRKKAKEYRVHIAFGRVIDVQQKALSAEFRDRDDVNWKIRNLSNGFIFRRNNIDVPVIVKCEGIRSVRALGLDFGAVDIGWNERHGITYVYEVNTAPGLTGTTVKSYANIFLKRFSGNLPDIPNEQRFYRPAVEYHIHNNPNPGDDLVQVPNLDHLEVEEIPQGAPQIFDLDPWGQADERPVPQRFGQRPFVNPVLNDNF